jgi:TfuA protein
MRQYSLMPTPIVFTGLSISREEAIRLVAAEVRPPIKRGDLDRLSDGSVVAIIDGEITEETAVPIDEIRRALRRGIRISGAASVGALRAYETRAEGMEGLGWVYEAYCSGRVDGTDEIAVLYEPDSYRLLTTPLVNIRFCLEHLSRQDVISAMEAAHAMTSLKELELEERDRRRILLRLADALGRHRVTKLLRRVPPVEADVKRSDAYELLRGLAPLNGKASGSNRVTNEAKLP